ncbi:MAG: DUF4124 domain-containing protein [Gammaproteobacteria bacterium]|nr:DUF4124 domain-containing protein [Gammaproteobacteria bacterium]MBU1555510.1 DUF4124 domain-containing protein [Gammaproteobacteria bacterium]MBU2072102.1 DUF4124 domain-containing protein [Gammaproteobacteria bacterium]MBU2181578.1 DUF4124 domain-containing protein [Gammaproteobacteria bacterium]MBU2203433.1 DUF4124 domain-containing protein [Gammaproteobacteria bacterium]
MKKILFFIAVFLFAVTPLQAQQSKKVFVTRDANGVLVFSDSPQPGAEEVNLSQRANIMAATDATLPNTRKEEVEAFNVEIVQPEEQGTVRDNTGSVYVSGKVNPMFERGLRLRLLLDGKPQGEPQNSAVFILREVDRGEHKLQMELFDQNGKLIATSPVTTFYLHRASVISPN